MRRRLLISALVLTFLLSGCSKSKPNEFFNNSGTSSIQSSSDEPTPGESSTPSESHDSTPDDNSSSIPDNSSEPRPEIEITKFFNSGTHPDLFYIKSTGFEFTHKQPEINAIITEGYITDKDAITGAYMLVYPMLGFDIDVFDSYTNSLYSFYDFTAQDDGSYRLDITSGAILDNIKQLSASTSMALLAGTAYTQSIAILDENGNLYTMSSDGNLMLIKDGKTVPIPDPDESSTSEQGTTSASDESSTSEQGTIPNQDDSATTSDG